MRKILLSILAATLVWGTASAEEHTPKIPGAHKAPVAEDAIPDGTIELKGGSVAAGVGFTWGRGELQYKDVTHHFTVKGLSLVDVGATQYTAKGHVYNLKRLDDFAGNYVAAAAGIAIAGGGTATYLRNENGVIIKLIQTDVGLKFNLSGDGVHISLKK